MNWNIFRRKPEPFEAFVGYLGGLGESDHQLMLRALELSNDLGLKGMRVDSIECRGSLTGDPTLKSLWLIGKH